MTLTSESTPPATGSPGRPYDRPAPGWDSRVSRVLFGNGTHPRWVRPSLLALLAVTAVLYLWGLRSAGWANEFYAAAVQAGTQDWKAWLFGSLDSGNAITVDKAPAPLWPMVLSGRLFGFSAFSMLLPQALMGVGAVALLNAAVRRCSGPAAGLIAGAVLALTPVAALMFRYNNPDALLVFLLVAGAYCMVRAIESASTRWIALAGCAMGFAFLAKMMQAFLVVPGFALAFLVAACGSLWARVGKLLIGAAAMILSCGWYIALVSLWPASSRPYIGGSTDNSLLQLALGYNGLDRMVAGDSSSRAGPLFGGDAGIGRLFGQVFGTEISWLLPAALIGLLAGLWLTRRTPRTGHVRSSLLLWGGWLFVTGAVFSFMGGTIHPYYTVALAPAIAALVAISVCELWRVNDVLSARITLGAMSAVTGLSAYILLDRTPDWLPALRWIVVTGSIVVAAVLLVGVHRLRRGRVVVAIAAMLFGIGAAAAYTVETVTHPHSGGIPTSGPSISGGPGAGVVAPGGLPGGDVPESAALEALVMSADSRWAAASVGSRTASSLELKTGTSIMAIGGFIGRDNSPTLAQFQQYVADKQIGYFIADGRGMPPDAKAGSAGDISTWVQQNFMAVDVGGTTVYDLSAPMVR